LRGSLFSCRPAPDHDQIEISRSHSTLRTRKVGNDPATDTQLAEILEEEARKSGYFLRRGTVRGRVFDQYGRARSAQPVRFLGFSLKS
jgi:hypothetical protein